MPTTPTIRKLTKALQPLGLNLRVAVIVIAMAFSTIGVTFQQCQCTACECNQNAQSCCSSEATDSCCNCKCDCGTSDCSCSCVYCKCVLGIDVEPISLPQINNSVKPIVFTTTISLTSPKLFLLASVRPDRTPVTSQTHIHALHCRWLI